MIKFIHTADWHLGNSFVHFDPEKAKKLNRARILAVESIFIYAKMNKIPLILCAGDTFDNGQLAPEKLLLDLFTMIKKYPEITVIMIAGNHDPIIANSIYNRVSSDSYPNNLHFVKENDTIPFEPLNLKIFASSLREKNSIQNPLHWLNDGDIDPNKINIAIAHGSIQNEMYRSSEGNFPIPPDFAIQKKLDYLALGDWHSFKQINPHTYYCGTPEPLEFGDDGYALEVSIEKRGDIPRIKKITGICQYTWTEQQVTLSDETFNDFKTLIEDVPETHIKKLVLSGFLSPKNLKVCKEFIAMNRHRYSRIEDNTCIAPDARDWSNLGDGYVRTVVQRLLEMKESQSPGLNSIMDKVIPGDQYQLNTEIPISEKEIIDAALLKLYKHFKDR